MIIANAKSEGGGSVCQAENPAGASPRSVSRAMGLPVLAALALLCCVGVSTAEQQWSSAMPSGRPDTTEGIAEYGPGDAALQGLPQAVIDKLLAAPSHRGRLLVRFKPGSAGSNRRQAHLAVQGRVSYAVSHVDQLYVVGVPGGTEPAALAAYHRNPAVLYVEPDYVYRLMITPNDADFGQLWGLHNTGQTVNGDPGTAGADIKALPAWDFWRGDPAFRIAVIDSGINYAHPDLAANVWTNPGEIPNNGIDDDGNGWIDDVHGYDFTNGDGDPMDDQSHGSHVSGTIGAAANNGIGVAGINWHCKLVALKCFDAGGSGNISDIIVAFDYAVASGIRVSNNSWGGPGFSQALYDLIEASQAIGHVFVAAAGNDARNADNQPMYPAAYDLPNIISVAATDNDDQLAFFSNFGAISVDLGAPGVTIYSTVWPSGYDYFRGTSMASPHVCGVAALVISRSPQFTWQEVREHIVGGVRPVDSLIGITASGGVVNALAALGDCNGNGIPDDQDIASGASEDCTGDGIPDECDRDCNGNGTPDSCNIGAAISSDCNGNRIPDECEPDCNNNDIADSCDVQAGTSPDCNHNVVPDECELTAGRDCNNNAVPDECDVATGTSEDCNDNAVPDECEPDCNGNGFPDDCDIIQGIEPDCNNNGIPDDCDIDTGQSADCSDNGIPDECEPDCNGNATPDSCDVVGGISADCNYNEVPDECEPDEDCNGNGVRDICDIGAANSADCNRNFIPDECEADAISEDCNMNLVPDECEPEQDCDANGIQDICDIALYGSSDCAVDLILDECQMDCNTNGIEDSCDITSGTSADANGNGVPDECDVIVYIDASAAGGNYGTSWPHAYTDLQTAVADTAATEIWVAAGIYTPSAIDRGATFRLRNNLTLYGGFRGGETTLDQRDPARYETILSGDLKQDDDAGSTSMIQADESCCDWHDTPGCGVESCEAAVCAVRRSCCTDFWSGTCAYIAANDLCCDLCTTENNCDNSLRVVTASGTDASAVLDGFTITRGFANRQYTSSNSGAAIYNDGGSPTIRNCKFVENRSIYVGGAMDNRGGANPLLVDCLFLGNSGLGGGAIFNWESSPTLVNCAFSGNTAAAGGAIRSWPGSYPTLLNCTLSANSALGPTGWAGGIHYDSPSYPTLINSILWGNTHSDSSKPEEAQIDGVAPPVVRHTCIQGWSGSFGGVGNFGLNPLFVDANGPDGVAGTADDDLRLGRESPCVDAGYNPALPPDLKDDLLGERRFNDDPDVRDTGIGVGPIVDIGAYERIADCNDNGISDETEIADGSGEDCNTNGRLDECDVARGSSADCEQNGIPDECQPDCDSDGLADACELAPIGTSADCNHNDIPDECDLSAATSLDQNGDGVPDECEWAPAVAAYGCRVLQITPAPGDQPVSLAVSSPAHPCLNKYVAAAGALVDTPISRLPAEWGTIYVGGREIMPGTDYHVRADRGDLLSAPGLGKTARWGDTVGTLGQSGWTPPNGVVNLSDILGILQRFANAVTAPPMAWVDIAPEVPDGRADLRDMTGVLQAFSQLPYPFGPPCP